MKNRAILLFAALLLGCGQTDVIEVRLTDYDLKIDVRTKQEYDSGHLDGAVNVPYTEIAERIEEHTEDKTKPILLYCRSGRRSGIATGILQDMGFRNAVNAGAYVKLKEQQVEGEKRDK
jgi:phage shock protein E